MPIAIYRNPRRSESRRPPARSDSFRMEKRNMTFSARRIGKFLAAAALAVHGALGLAGAGAAETAARLEALPPSTAYGDYAVGAKIGFAVDNRQRFDPWNTAYASDAYRAMLRKVEASGQPRTVIFHLWYPAEADRSAGRLGGSRSPWPAVSGERAQMGDYFFRDETFVDPVLRSSVLFPDSYGRLHFRDGGALSELSGGAMQEAFEAVGKRYFAALRGAYIGAPPASAPDGFPIVVLSHGLGDNYSLWNFLGEFLASHGYVVAAPSFVSDSGVPLVFHDPDSAFAGQASADEKREAYGLLMGERKVIPNFLRLMFGAGSAGAFDPARAKAVPGGVRRATTMMQNLFRQRVADVGLLIHTMKLLGAERADCAAGLNSMGATSAARELCGLLAGRVGNTVGLAGHSLGSMTAQMAVNHIPGVAAALGINNGAPFSWTPEEFFGGGLTPDGLPVGSRKPAAQLIGDEDDFVQQVFVGLFQNAVAAAGGDPETAFPLAPERAVPERRANPQPVALSAWLRQTSDRVLVIVRDVDHGLLVDNFGRLFPWPEFGKGALPFGLSPSGRRKAVGGEIREQGFSGAPYDRLGWAEAGDAGAVYMPHLVRDWYARAVFDRYLKNDEDARRRLQGSDPFGDLTSVRREVE